MVSICGMITGAITIAMIAQAVAARGRKGPSTLPDDRLRAIELKLSEMQQSLDAVAVEIERVSEGQRFTAKLLSDRAVAPAK
jgi:predicted small lipoprotein YifL